MTAQRVYKVPVDLPTRGSIKLSIVYEVMSDFCGVCKWIVHKQGMCRVDNAQGVQGTVGVALVWKQSRMGTMEAPHAGGGVGHRGSNSCAGSSGGASRPLSGSTMISHEATTADLHAEPRGGG